MTTPRATFASLREEMRALNENAQNLSKNMGAAKSSLSGTILPALGLTAAFSILTGGINDASSAGLVLSSALYGLQTELFDFQHNAVSAFTPILEILGKAAEAVFSWFNDLSDFWQKVILYGAAGMAALKLIGPVVRTIGSLLRMPLQLLNTIANVISKIPTGFRNIWSAIRAMPTRFLDGFVRMIMGGARAIDWMTQRAGQLLNLLGRAGRLLGRLRPGLGIGPEFLPGGELFENFQDKVLQDMLRNAQVGDMVPRLTGTPGNFTQSLLSGGREGQPQSAAPMTYSNVNHFYISALDPDDMVRQMRRIVESGGLDFANANAGR